MQLPIEYWKTTFHKLGVRGERRVRRSAAGARAGFESLERRHVLAGDVPIIAGFLAAPTTVTLGTQITLTATGVTDPGGHAISQVAFFRDADNDGALTSADGSPLGIDTNGLDGWSITASTASFPGGLQRYFAVATDAPGYASGPAIAINTVLIAPKIIDNGGTGYTTVSSGSGYWSTTGSTAAYGGAYQFEFGATNGYAQWTFPSLPAGEYRVSATWPASTSNGTNVPYTIYDGSLDVGSARVNQRVSPAADVVVSTKNFQNLGAFSVVNGAIVVRMANSSGDGRAIADAVRIEHIGPTQQTSDIRVFDGGTELADGSTTINLGTAFVGTPTASRTFTVRNSGLSDLVLAPLTQALMPAGITLVSSYGATTLARGTSTTFQVALSATSPGSVSGLLTLPSNDPDEANFGVALTGLVNASRIIDNGGTGYTTVSSKYWSTSGGGYGGGYQFEYGATGGYAQWTFPSLLPGSYRISATWPASTGNGTNVPYAFADGGFDLGIARVNQRVAPAGDVVGSTNFQNLGTFSVVSGALVVRVTNSSGDGKAIADAVRIEYLGAVQPVPDIRVFDGSAELTDSASTVNLGTTFFGTALPTKTLTVKNSGLTDLVLAPLTQAAMPAGVTLVSSYGTTTVPRGGETTFQVALSPLVTGNIGGLMRLPSNDPDEAAFGVTLTGIVDAAKIIDNGDAGYTTVSSNYWSTTGGYQFEFGATGGYAEWSFPNLPAGEYRVSAAWPEDPAWSSSAPYSILDGGVSLGAVRVNQQLAPDGDVVAGSRTFQDLGFFGITNGSLAVRLAHEGPRRVVADAICVQYVGKLPEVQFNATGSRLEIDGATATVLDFGQSERSGKAVEVVAVTNRTSSTVSLTQVTPADLPAGYVLVSGFGVSTLGPGESAFARIRLDAIAPGTYGGTVPILAGAHSFGLAITGEVIKTPVLVDNGDPEFATTGTGWQNGSAGEGFQDDSLKTSGASSGKAATWTIDGLAAGAYLVYATYLPSSDNTAAAHYNLYDGARPGGALEQHGTVNQQLAPDDVVVSGKTFGYVGQINVSSSTLTVELNASSLAGGLALADAIYVVPATPGTYFGFSAPSAIVTGSSESIQTGFVDPDGELADAINLYRDSNNDGVLDVVVDQLMYSDTSPIDGFDFDASVLASGTHRLFVTAIKNGAAVAGAFSSETQARFGATIAASSVIASNAISVTAAEWWQVAITQSRAHGEALFNTTGDLTADPTPIRLTQGMSWIDAVYSRVQGQVTTYNSWEGQYYSYAFPYRLDIGVPSQTDGAFDVDTQRLLKAEHLGFDLTLSSDTKMIVLEDLTRAARNDYDYDDQYWLVAVTPYVVDLDVNSDNTAQLDRSKIEEEIEEDPAKPGVIVPVGPDNRVPMVVEVTTGQEATLSLNSGASDRVKVYSSTGQEVLSATKSAANMVDVQGGVVTVATTTWTLWVEATAPSASMADIAFTLTASGSGMSSTDIVRATAMALRIDGPGEIDADTGRGWVSLLVNPDDYGPVDRAADGLPVQFRVFRKGVPAFTSSVDIADGAAVLPVPTSTVPGDTYRVEGWFAGQMIGATGFPVIAGAPATITPSAPQGSIVTDGQRLITVTAEIRDRHGNVVEDGTPVEWLLENLSSSFASLPTRFSSVTSGGRAEVSFKAPDTLSSPVMRIRSGSATRLVELPATFTTATLAGPVSLDIATAQSGTVTLATDATDGTPVFWTISNGDIRTYAGVVGGGQAQLAVAATGIWGRVGPCVVTATVGGRLAVHVIDFYSSDPFFLEIDRFVLCGDKTEDGEETLHFPAVTPLPFAPSVVPDTSRAVPYPATATVTIHGVPYGTYAVEFTDSRSAMLAEIVGLDPSGRVQLSGNGKGAVQLRSKGHFDGDPQKFNAAAVTVRVRPEAGQGMFISQDDPPPSRVVTAQFVEHTWYTRTWDAVQSFFGGDPQTGPGVASNAAGGMLIVGDIGSLVKNLWRWGSGQPVNHVEVALSSVGLATELAVGAGELADAPISGIRALVAALANVPAGQILPILYRRALSNGADMVTLVRFIGRIGSETSFQVLKNVLTSEDLIRAAIKATDDLGDAVFDGLKHVSAMAVTGGIEAAQRVLLVLANLSDAAKAELKLIAKADFPVLCEHLGFILKSGTVDAALLSKVLAKDALFTATYNRLALLRDLRILHAADRLDVMVRAVAGATLPNFIRGNLYEIQAAAAIMRAGGGEVKIFRELVKVAAEKTDIDFIINGVYYQAKSGPVDMNQVKAWVTKATEHGKAAGNAQPVLKYVMPQSAIDATSQKVKDFLEGMNITIVPVAIP